MMRVITVHMQAAAVLSTGVKVGELTPKAAAAHALGALRRSGHANNSLRTVAAKLAYLEVLSRRESFLTI
eukprot:SAG11_NODE_15351_length_581_cov_0.921162_1_plen_69_part_10